MSTFKVDDILGELSTDAINLPNKFKVEGNIIEQGYTASATEPSSANEGDFWWDSTQEVLYRYINGEFKNIGIIVPVTTNSYGDRGFLAGGNGSNANIDYHDITTLGNMSDFGNLTRNFQRGAGASSGHRALFMGGGNSTNSGNRIHFTANYTNTIDYITCATTGNATDFGDASSVSIDSSATSDGVTAVHYLSVIDGVNPGTNSNILDKVTIATTGNATDFGDLGSVGWVNADVGVSNNTRGLFAGGAGYSSPWAPTNPIHYITIATPGNSTDFGDLTVARYGAPGVGGGTSDRGIWAGGYTASGYVTSIDYVTISTTGNAADFGDLTGRQTSTDTYQIGASYNATRGCFYYAYYNDIHYITLATTGNSSDFGDQLSSAGSTAYARSSSGYAS